MADVTMVPSQVTPGAIEVTTTTDRATMVVRRDLEPASFGDVIFIAYALRDLRLLVDALRGRASVSPSTGRAIERRVRSASVGPWRASIEADGGQGGCDVIQVSDSDDEPDMYLWIGGDLAPSAYFRFVAAARQDVAALLSAMPMEGTGS